MGIFDAIILGIVEGITEFLPISSTGHLILVGSVLGLVQTDFIKSFEIAIQLGAIAAVVILYWKSFLKIPVLLRLIVGFVPTGIIGVLLYTLVKTYLLGNEVVVLWALLLGGIAIIVFEYLQKDMEEAHDEVEAISYKQSALIGLFQAIAIIPGVSRSAATIIGGRLLGLSRKTIVEFSFLLAVPTMLAATGFDLIKSAGSFNLGDFGVLAIGFVVSLIVAIFSIRLLLQFVRRHNFVPFGIYRIVLALLFFFIIL